MFFDWLFPQFPTISESRDEPPHATESSYRSAGKVDDQKHIASAIDSLIENYKSIQQENGRQNKQKFWWDKFTAKGVAVYTILTAGIVILSAFSTRYAYLTEVATRDQADTAELALKATARAYMFRDAVRLEIPGFPMTESGTDVIAAVSFKNGGQTPAYNSHIEARTGVLPYPLNEPIEAWNGRLPMSNGKGNRITIFKDDPLQISIHLDRNITPAVFDTVVLGRVARFYFWGEITWVDTFKSPHWLHFCYMWGGPSFASTMQNRAKSGTYEYCDPIQ